MELLNIFEEFVKNPFTNTLSLSEMNQQIANYHKNSDTHNLRELIDNKIIFSDMSHSVPLSGISHFSINS